MPISTTVEILIFFKLFFRSTTVEILIFFQESYSVCMPPLYNSRDFYIFSSLERQMGHVSLQQQRFLYIFKAKYQNQNTHSTTVEIFIFFKPINTASSLASTTVEIFICSQGELLIQSPMLYNSRDFYMFSSSKAKRTTHLCNSRDFYIFSSGTSQGRHKTLRQQRFLYVFKWKDFRSYPLASTTVEIFIFFQDANVQSFRLALQQQRF